MARKKNMLVDYTKGNFSVSVGFYYNWCGFSRMFVLEGGTYIDIYRGRICISGEFATILNVDNNHDVVEIMKNRVDCSDVDFDEEAGTFFAYADNANTLIEMLKVVYPNITSKELFFSKQYLQQILDEKMESAIIKANQKAI